MLQLVRLFQRLRMCHSAISILTDYFGVMMWYTLDVCIGRSSSTFRISSCTFKETKRWVSKDLGHQGCKSASPIPTPLSCSVCVLCFLLLIAQISSVRMLNHPWQVTFFPSNNISRLDLHLLLCEELWGWISQNSPQHQIDDPLIILPLTIDNGHEAGYAKSRVVSRAELGWSGQFL